MGIFGQSAANWPPVFYGGWLAAVWQESRLAENLKQRKEGRFKGAGRKLAWKRIKKKRREK